jgi:hypothetical protein
MSKHVTIAEAAQKALHSLSRPASIKEIYVEILRLQLYQFNTPRPEHVLRTMIRRHTKNVERVDSSEMILFEMIDHGIYSVTSATKRTL